MKKLVASAMFSLFVISMACAGEYPKNTFDIGPEFFTHKYKEPGLMKETGNFYGFVVTSTNHGDWMWAVQLEAATGSVKYDGGIQDGETGEVTPHTVSGITDWLVDGRLLVGPEYHWNGGYGSPYIGLGYRWLWDNLDKDKYGYDRAANYLYAPLGGTATFVLGDGWSLSPTAEYDYLIIGEQVSEFSDVDPGFNDLNNRQSSGYGWRVSVSLEKDFATWNLKVQPFVRYWKLDKSKTTQIEYEGIGPVGIGWEPENETTEVGIQALLTF